jgi:hypothetical protein
MNFFEEASLRLKQQLKLQTDKEVAELLGLSQRAWVGRKSRNNFPETELYALNSKRPELDIDIVYVMTGVPVKQQTETLAEKVWLDCYRRLPEDKKTEWLLRVMAETEREKQ